MRAWLGANRTAPTTVLVTDGAGELAFTTRHRVVALDLLTADPALVRSLLASERPLSRLLETVAATGQPVTHVLRTTDTWLASLRPLEAGWVDYRLLRPGMCRQFHQERVHLGDVVHDAVGLTVWRRLGQIQATSRSPPTPRRR
jgi:hypothetical protein